MLFGRDNAPSIAAGNSRGLEQVVNVRSQDGALGDLSFQVGPQAHRTSNIVADSSGQELRVAGRERLIVVEDDPVTRTMLVGYFSENNFDVVGAGSCAECRQALRTRTDLVFLDVQLPDGDGFEAAGKMLAADEPPAVVLISSRDAADYGSRIGASGARGFISKADLSVGALEALLGAAT